MTITPLFSGSSGNCTLVSTGSARILIDAGVAVKHIERAVEKAGESMHRINAIVMTHEHQDHSYGIKGILKRYDIPIYATAETWAAVLDRAPDVRAARYREVRPGEVFSVVDASLRAFRIPHDAACPVGYRIEAGGRCFALATDIGHVEPEWMDAVRGCDAVILECSYDEGMLKSSNMPDVYKERMSGERGHLSNEASASALAELVHSGTRQVCLGHMSTKSNTPELVHSAVETALKAAGLEVGKDCSLTIAERNDVSRSIWL